MTQSCISLFLPHRRMYKPMMTMTDPSKLPIWSCSCRMGISNIAAIIWTKGLNAAVKTGPRFLTHHDIPTTHKPEPTIPAKITANTSVLPLKTQIERLLDVEKLKVAD